MVAINPEMLKELLEEFTEKEQVNFEEMNAINQQIGELEKRIESSKEKLSSITTDRDRIQSMRERYLAGTWRNFRSETLACLSLLNGGTPPQSTANAAPPAPPPASSKQSTAAAKTEKTEAKAEFKTVSEPQAKVEEPAPAPAPAPNITRSHSRSSTSLPAAEVKQAAEVKPAVDVEDSKAGSSFETLEAIPGPEDEVGELAQSAIEEAPPDDPILSSLSSTAGHVPDIEKALASGSEYDAVAQEPALTDSGFSWTSTAISPGAEESEAKSDVKSDVNPWGAEPPAVQSSSTWPASPDANSPPAISAPEPAAAPSWGSPADAWGQPSEDAQPAAAPAPWGTPAQQQQADSPWGTPAQSAPPPPPTPPTPTPPQPAQPSWGSPSAASAWGAPNAPAPAAPAPQADSPWGSNSSAPTAPENSPAPAPAPNAGSPWGGGSPSPWGNPSSESAQADAAGASQAQAPAGGGEDNAATISPVKGRRKREAAPAFDWGEPQDAASGGDDDESGRKISDALKGFFK